MENTIISLKNLCKEFDGNPVVKNIDLDIKKGQFVTFLGPSGCGKTTTLRMIAGFELPTSGEVLFDGKNIETLPPNKRKVNTVFQKYALFPHLNVFNNVAFGLKLKKLTEDVTYVKGGFLGIFPRPLKDGETVPDGKETFVKEKQVGLSKDVIEKKVKRALKMVGLSDYEKRDVSSLSGGQQQRVAIARAIVNEPQVLLLDEPLGALDLKMRQEMQFELMQMHRELKITFIYVTHDQSEALTMSDTVVVMKDGEIVQVGAPTDIYNDPINAFVADFIGDSNIFDGVQPAENKVSFCGIITDCIDEGFEIGKPIDVVIRPEDFILKPYGEGVINGEVTNIVFKGVHYEIIVKSNGFEFEVQNTKMLNIGDKIGLLIEPSDIHIMEKPLQTNTFECVFGAENTLKIENAEYVFDPTVLFEGKNYEDIDGKKAEVAVSFSAVDLSDDGNDAPMAGNVESMIFKGKNYLVDIKISDSLRVYADTPYLWDKGDNVGIKIQPSGFRFVRFLDDEQN